MPSFIRIIIVLSGMCLISAPVATAQDREVPDGLSEYMSADEFRASGLHRLDEEELAHFEAWFLRTMGFAPEERVLPGPDEVPDRITAHIDGTFNGWAGTMRFTLDNGQVWETQNASSFSTVRPLDSPRVTIRRGVMGSYRMQVEGYNTTTRVRRVE